MKNFGDSSRAFSLPLEGGGPRLRGGRSFTQNYYILEITKRNKKTSRKNQDVENAVPPEFAL